MIEIEYNSTGSLVIDSWIAPSVDGFNEVNGFYERWPSRFVPAPMLRDFLRLAV